MGTFLRGRFHTPGRPRVPTRLAARTLPLPGLPARPLLSLHLGPVSAPLAPLAPSLSLVGPPPPGPSSGSPPRLQPRRADRSPVEPEARASGCQERSSTGGAPAEVAPDSIEAQGPALQPPETSPTCLQLTSAPGLPPLYPSELLKFATRSPSRRGEKLRELRELRELRDSPPGSTRRCRAPRGPGLRAVRTTAMNPRAGGQSGNGEAEQQGSRL